MNTLLSLLVVLGLNVSDVGPKKQAGVYALTNARIETVTNGVIERGTVVIRGGLIESVGANVEIPADAEVIDCDGLTIYPGMIDSSTQLGLSEIGTFARTRDYDEIGDLTPQIQALTAVNPNSVLIPVARVSGVTTVVTEPSGGLFPGTATMINLHGYTPEQMKVAGTKMIVVQFPRSGRRGRFDRRTDEDIEKSHKEVVKKLDDMWERGRVYARIDSAYTASPDPNRTPEYVPELQALLPVIRGEMALLIKVDAAKDITAAIEWVEAHHVDKVIFSGVREGWRVADKLAAAAIPCIVGPALSTPTRESDRYDKPYANASLIKAAGVKIALGSGESENVRNLPYNAGFAATYGLGREAAFRAVTIEAAEILGVDGELGSVEGGKRANIFVADGDPFETKTQVRHLFIDGYPIPLVSRHTLLYDEFLNRDPSLRKHNTVTPPTN